VSAPFCPRWGVRWSVPPTWGRPIERQPGIGDCPDWEDNFILDLVTDVGALMLVSADTDLISMSPWRGVPILTPTQFANAPPPKSIDTGQSTVLTRTPDPVDPRRHRECGPAGQGQIVGNRVSAGSTQCHVRLPSKPEPSSGVEDPDAGEGDGLGAPLVGWGCVCRGEHDETGLADDR